MKSLILLICLIFVVAYSQTNVYFGECPTSGDPSEKVYKIGIVNTVGDSTFQWLITYFQRLMGYIPSLGGKSALYTIGVANFTNDVILPILNCEYDLILAETAITSDLEAMGAKFTNHIVYTNPQAYYSWFTNLPKVGNNNSTCDTNCIKVNVCSASTIQEIADFANNGNLPINIRFDTGTYRNLVADELRQALVDAGFSGTINLSTFNYDSNGLPFILNTNLSTAVELAFATQTATACPSMAALNPNVSVVSFLSNINPPPGFPICTTSATLKDLLNFAIEKYRSSTQFCEDLIDFNYYCKTDPPLFEIDVTNDPCFNYPRTPIC